MKRLTSLLLVLVACALVGGCGGSKAPWDVDTDAENGRLLLRQFGCGSCHVIPGVATADGMVGPPLTGIAHRVYLAGVLPNTPDTMAAFIREPQIADPRTAMPDLGIGERHARDMVTYLYRLK
jgi:cytochrome c2